MEKHNRILSVEINGVKNVIHGKLAFPECNSFLYGRRTEKCGILGIYGANGSGKTALIDAMYILKSFSLGRPLARINKEGKIVPDRILENFICAWEDEAECRFQFSQVYEGTSYLIDYSFSLRKTKDEIPFLSKETIQIKKPNEKGDGFVRFGKPISIDYANSVNSAIALYSGFVLERGGGGGKAEMEGIVDLAKDIQIFSTSCTGLLLSDRLYQKVWATLRPDFRQLFSILHALTEQISYQLFVYTIYEGAIMTLGTDVFLGGDETNHGLLIFKKPNPSPITARERVLMMTIEKQVNKTVSSFVPGFQMRTAYEKAGKNENGEQLFDLRFYSVKGKAEIPLSAESNGIQKMVSLASAIAQVYAEPDCWLVVDELDSGVFEHLLRQLLLSLKSEAKGQMLFTAHNLTVLEVLPHENVVFTTANPKNRFINLIGIKPTNNFRDFYLRSLAIGGQKEELIDEIDSEEISSALYDSRDCIQSLTRRSRDA